MTFRNDHEAALQRASALELELAETKRKLADVEAAANSEKTRHADGGPRRTRRSARSKQAPPS